MTTTPVRPRSGRGPGGGRTVELTLDGRNTPLTVASAPPPPETPPKPRRVRAWLTPALLSALLTAGVLALPAELSGEAKAALFAFGLAVVLWSTTSLPAAWTALAGVVVLIALGGAEQEVLFSSLASDVVWLMIGAFVLGGAVQTSGLATRLTGFVAGEQRTVSQLCWRVTLLLLPLSFLIPSTSGRAAVVLPLYKSVTAAVGDRKVSRALSLLIPTVILVSTIATLVGAGSHLLANNLLEEVGGESISFFRWALYGVPFAVVASLLSCLVVLRLFLDPVRRNRVVDVQTEAAGRLAGVEVRTLLITVAMVAAWCTEALHGVEIATVAVLGAIALTMPRLGVLSWSAGVKSIAWNLVVFVGAALVLGQALIETGAADWIVREIFALTGVAGLESPALVLVVLAAVTLTSHIYMTSHAARAAALVPPLLYLGQTLDMSLPAVMFIGTVGMDYCLTFPVSSKALLLFSELDGDSFDPPDLLKLSSVLLLVHLGLIVAFYFGYWQFVGLAL